MYSLRDLDTACTKDPKQGFTRLLQPNQETQIQLDRLSLISLISHRFLTLFLIRHPEIEDHEQQTNYAMSS